jgi:hypothetical protein
MSSGKKVEQIDVSSKCSGSSPCIHYVQVYYADKTDEIKQMDSPSIRELYKLHGMKCRFFCFPSFKYVIENGVCVTKEVSDIHVSMVCAQTGICQHYTVIKYSDGTEYPLGLIDILDIMSFCRAFGKPIDDHVNGSYDYAVSKGWIIEHK